MLFYLLLIVIWIIVLSVVIVKSTEPRGMMADTLLNKSSKVFLNMSGKTLVYKDWTSTIMTDGEVGYIYFMNYIPTPSKKRDDMKTLKYIEEYRKTHDNTVMLILDGEPCDLTRVPLQEHDIILTTKHTMIPEHKNTYYYPCLSLFIDVLKKDLTWDDLVKTSDVTEHKKKFCVFAYSNCDVTMDGVEMRRQLYEKLNTASGNRVDNLGKCYNTAFIRKKSHYIDNKTMFRPYKFVISAENNKIPGYNTEKLVNPILAHSIPIYYGSLDIMDEHINRRRVICVEDFDSIDECVEYVMKVDGNDELFHRIINEPFFCNNEIPDAITLDGILNDMHVDKYTQKIFSIQ